MMKKYPIKISHAYAARGFSLVELMVALLIGLIITIGVVQIFGATRATYQLDEGLARAQENGRFALEFLTQDIRHAGYMGCYRPTNVPDTRPFNYLAGPGVVAPWKLNFQGVTAAEFVGTGIGSTYNTPPTRINTSTGWSPALNSLFPLPTTPSALPGTDVIAIQRLSAETWPLVPPFITPASVFIDPTFAGRINPPDILMVTDCKHAAVFMATSIITATGQIDHAASGTTNRCATWLAGGLAGGPAAACTDLFDNPGPSAVLGRMETVVFFVANDPTVDPVNPRPTLYRSVVSPNGTIIAGGAAQALVEGVENFQVLYGVDAAPPFDGTPDSYVTANVANFAQVVSVQIGILVYGVNATGSANDAEIDTDTQVVAGTNIFPPTSGTDQRKKRRVFNTTIQLRNRGS